MPEPFFFNETSDPAKLTNRQRGQLAEVAFMRKAASLGLPIAKPCSEGERYDFIARVHNICWRIQVKSAWRKSARRHHYRVKTSGGNGQGTQTPYSAAEIDFLVAYVHPDDIWYVFPANFIAGRQAICILPGSKRSPYDHYREAWKLMNPMPNETASATAVETKKQAAGT
ncbi:MAG TPA: group I intron-associated PD-(D/E)XK endonuclease [Terriglobales bacterium]|nr:group I intron-associated PD-(D/E)XK endonuclease [Terriglobales bacterium]